MGLASARLNYCNSVPRIFTECNKWCIISFIESCLHAEPPRPLDITLTATLRSEEPDVSSFLHWSGSMTHNKVNLDTSYVITLFSESNQFNFTTLNTSIWLTLFYDQDYNISMISKNCAGNSEPAELYLTWDG